MATASRGHELLARVQQLEAEMPAVEKALLSETNQLRFAYTPGAEWHASIRNDQNHCTQGDLPRFIRNSYEECRGPPRLFLLDKFDVAGAGACLKRYTDPSFFRTEWASSELMKAERVQRDKKARREKKKGRRRRNVDGKESIPVDQFHTRFSHELKEPAQPVQGHPRMWNQPVSERSEEASLAVESMNYNDNLNALSRHLAEAQGLGRDVTRTGNIFCGEIQEALQDDFGAVPRTSKVSHGEIQGAFLDDSLDIPRMGNVSSHEIQEALLDDLVDVPIPSVLETLVSSQSMELKGVSAISVESKHILRKLEEAGSSVSYKDEMVLDAQETEATDAVDDGASEGDQFLDALTTMESEADTDSEPGFRHDKDADMDRVSDTNEAWSTSQEGLKSPGLYQTSTDEKMTMSVEQSQISEEDSRLSGLYDSSRGKTVTLPVQYSSTALQDDLRTPGTDRTSTNGNLTLSAELSPKSLLFDSSGQDSSHASSVPLNGLDVKGISLSTTAVHIKSHSIDSITSSSSRKAKNVQLLDGSWDNVAVHSKHFTPLRDERGVTKSYEPGAVSSISGGVVVSKMVAAFERGSLEQINDDKEPENKIRDSGKVPTTLESVVQSVSRASEEVDNVDILEDHEADNYFLHNSLSPDLASPASSTSTSSKVSSTRCHASPSPPHITVEGTPSCHMSQGSSDSPPDSPTFSALHSPMSLIRTTRNILSSPDSHSLGFSTELLSPGSPTSVPILALSPTSHRVPPPFDSLDQGNHETVQSVNSLMVEDPFSISLRSSSPAKLSLTLPTEEHPKSASLSPTIVDIIHDNDAPLSIPAEDSFDHFSPSSEGSCNDLLPSFSSGTPPIGSFDIVSPAPLPMPAEDSFDHFSPSPEGSHSDRLPSTSSGTPLIRSFDIVSPAPLTLPAGDSFDHFSPSPEGSRNDLLPSTSSGAPPIGSFDIVSPLQGSLDDSKKFNAALINLPDVLHPSNAERELRASPKMQRIEYSGTASFSPSSHKTDDIATSSISDDDSPDHRSLKAVESVLLKPLLPPSSPLQSESFHDLTLHNISNIKHDKPPLSAVSTRSDEMASKVSHSEASHGNQFSKRMTVHKRFPSVPPSAMTTDFASELFSKSSQEPSSAAPSIPAPDTQVSASKFVHELPSSSPLSQKLRDSLASTTPSKFASDSQVSAYKFEHDLPSPSQHSRKLHDLPFPVPIASHKRFPSFPHSEKAVLELASSSSSKSLLDSPILPAVSLRPAENAQVPKSKLVQALESPSAPSQALQSLPPTTLHPKSEHDSLPTQSPPRRTLHELPPPPPPLRTPPPISIAKSSVVDVQDALLDAIASHDKSTLKKVKTMQNLSLRKGDGRSHLLEQIRAQSFNLRHTVVEKVDAPIARPVTNINVAAILEKANAIRQAFAGSDEDDDDDDDWSDV